MLENAVFWIGVVRDINDKAVEAHRRFQSEWVVGPPEERAERREAEMADRHRRWRGLTSAEIRVLSGEQLRPNVLDIHTLVLALFHIDTSLRFVLDGLRGSLAALARGYCEQFLLIKDLRDALEHEEEYLAGKGWKPTRLIPEGTIDHLEAGIGRHTATGPEGLMVVEVLGAKYYPRACIDLGLSLRSPLLAEIARLTPERRAGQAQG